MNGLGGFEVDHVVGEAFDRGSTHRQVALDLGNGPSGSREAADLFERGVYRGEQPMPQTGPAFFVPTGSVIQLCGGLVLRPKPFHRFARFASVRRRTSSQEAPFDSPRRTLRARRSISAAHAASTSAFPSGGASRLSRSSAATLARSSGPSFRASSKISSIWAMNPTLPLQLVAPERSVGEGDATAICPRVLGFAGQ